MDIDGLGPAVVKQRRFKFSTRCRDLYSLGIEICSYDRIAIKSLRNYHLRFLRVAQLFDRVLFALGIRYWLDVALHYPANLINRHLKSASLNELESTPEIGPKIAESLYTTLKDKSMITLIEKLKRLVYRPNCQTTQQIRIKKIYYFNGKR